MQHVDAGVLAGPRAAPAIGHTAAAALTGMPVTAVRKIVSALRVAVVAVVPLAKGPIGVEYAALCRAAGTLAPRVATSWHIPPQSPK